MLLINLYGAPGAGKSTGAAYIFSMLKLYGINAELVTEFAKDKVWEESKEVFKNQAYIFGKQYFRITRCQSKVDVIITDSPLMLSSYYVNDDVLGEEFHQLVKKVSNSFNQKNYFINRVKDYNPKGRFQTEEESDIVALELKNYLQVNGISAKEVNGDINGYLEIINDIMAMLNCGN